MTANPTLVKERNVSPRKCRIYKPDARASD